MEVDIVRTKSGFVVVCFVVACREPESHHDQWEGFRTDRVWPALPTLPCQHQNRLSLCLRLWANFLSVSWRLLSDSNSKHVFRIICELVRVNSLNYSRH